MWTLSDRGCVDARFRDGGWIRLTREGLFAVRARATAALFRFTDVASALVYVF
jgi:hypothetical protein